MKKAIPILLIFIVILNNAQASKSTITAQPKTPTDTSNPVRDYNYYRTKGISQSTIGWFLVSGGCVSSIIGVIKILDRGVEEFAYAISFSDAPKSNKARDGANFIYAGVAMMAGSIPLFISGHRNKLKARVAPGSNRLSSFIPATANKYVTGITLTIPIGK